MFLKPQFQAIEAEATCAVTSWPPNAPLPEWSSLGNRKADRPINSNTTVANKGRFAKTAIKINHREPLLAQFIIDIEALKLNAARRPRLQPKRQESKSYPTQRETAGNPTRGSIFSSLSNPNEDLRAQQDDINEEEKATDQVQLLTLALMT
ncbi:hypothetical protein Nepgr_011490 [Nepenthes gracilis]|uniref:Uncharacterized protein n=1 Tax=Nepenthes gracilis TaxID=150966 RepID=A0AAD3SFF4_NEPGR|nr:hypothetical protein Nepgr_011490 [Nepenthes gracilis]